MYEVRVDKQMAVRCFVARMRDRWACYGVFISARTLSPPKLPVDKLYLIVIVLYHYCTRGWFVSLLLLYTDFTT
jgi:hypothetical protein